MKKAFYALLLLQAFLSISSSTNAQNTNITGPTGSGQFGYSVTILSNGNYVIADPYFDDGAITDAGAVYLYNGNTHALISTLKGSTANNNVGLNGVTALNNGNFVVNSSNWDNGPVTDVGAVTWCNGTTGLTGVVSSSNSLVGSTANDLIGGGGVTPLSNGNYVVRSNFWNNGPVVDAGAVTFGNGTTGITGVIRSSNSLVGSTANDNVGEVRMLNNSNYMVISSNWDNGAATDAGAVTFGNGTTGRTGVVSSSNSLVGSTANDVVGSGVTALSNGNYVVRSPNWDNGALTNVGAVTWCNGTTGTTGMVSSSNSLVGSTASDNIGNGGITVLSNGNYVVISQNWYNGTATNAGAVTWCNGTTGRTGMVSSSNSLVGSMVNDAVGIGGVTALSNGNYVVINTNWDNGTATNAGAITWCNGTTGRTGVVSSSNSLVGSMLNDAVGSGGVTALSNGNYVVRSQIWDDGTAADVGAVTFGNGTTGITGMVSSSNSLVGNSFNDNVGSAGITPLSNGNYVVSSPNWNNWATIDVGAVTWCNGTTGRSGEVSSSNSLVGSTVNNEVGEGGVTALSNGNYVVGSPSWDNGAATDAGAVTFGNGTTGITGIVSSTNSLVSNKANDYVGGGGITALNNGNYLVRSQNWDNGTVNAAGAVTWCNGATGLTGLVSSSNSLVGSTAIDVIGGGGITALSNGNYVIISPNWDNGLTTNAGAVTFGNGATGVFGTITSCNSTFGALSGGGSNIIVYYNSTYDNYIVSRRLENLVTIYNSTGMSLANSLDVASTNINGGNAVPLFTSPSCRIIATLQPSGGSAVNGMVNAKAWIEPSVPNHIGEPFVARHYEVTASTNPNTATGKVTLYFTQQEFTDFNNHPSSTLNLPTGPSDAAGKANLRIAKYAGQTNNGTGLPNSYTNGAVVLDPADGDIVWNSNLNRWEVSIDVTGFGGFIVQTNVYVLPLTLLEFNGRLVNNNSQLNWKTTNEENNASFDIERSTDGRTYTYVGNVAALNTAGTNLYHFTDNNVSALAVPIVYYRLKQKDINDRFTHSRIVALFMDNTKSLVLLYPNPVNNEANLTITTNKAEKITINIIDNVGRIIKQQQLFVSAGSSSLSIDVKGLVKGMYHLDLKGQHLRERKQFVKQ
jgi:muramidase (phage lysozyme)